MTGVTSHLVTGGTGRRRRRTCRTWKRALVCLFASRTKARYEKKKVLRRLIVRWLY